MPTPQIRWREKVLWPYPASHIPEHHHVLTNRAEADARFLRYAQESLGSRLCETFTQIWRLAMDTGFQSNGLLVASFSGLSHAAGFKSLTPGRDLGVWAQDNDLLRRVPGRMFPYENTEHLPGGRHRAFLVLGGTCDYCVVPKPLQRTVG